MHVLSNFKYGYTLIFFLGLLTYASGIGYLVATRTFPEVERSVEGASAERGEQLIEDYGCPACHTIEGIRGAEANVGNPLTNYDEHHYIAGSVPNTTENLVQWIMNPQSIEPGTAMPNLGVTEAEARDIAAYLYQQ
jgi:cytochrome c1